MSEEVSRELDICNELSKLNLHDVLVLPLDRVWLDGLLGQYLAVVYELFGTYFKMLYSGTRTGLRRNPIPPDVVQRAILDGVISLDRLHESGYCHGRE